MKKIILQQAFEELNDAIAYYEEQAFRADAEDRAAQKRHYTSETRYIEMRKDIFIYLSSLCEPFTEVIR